MSSSDDTTIFLNSEDANQIYRICILHGVDPDTANKIAIDVGKVEARSKSGELKAIAWTTFKKWWATILGTISIAATGAIAWALDLINVGSK